MKIKNHNLRKRLKRLMARELPVTDADEYFTSQTAPLSGGHYICVEFNLKNVQLSDGKFILRRGDICINDDDDNIIANLPSGFRSLTVYNYEYLDWENDGPKLNQDIVEEILYDVVLDCADFIFRPRKFKQ